MGRGEKLTHPSQAKTLAKDPAKEITQSICPFCDLSVPWWQKKEKQKKKGKEKKKPFNCGWAYTLGRPVFQGSPAPLNGRGGQNI